jgi:hypothetical protein
MGLILLIFGAAFIPTTLAVHELQPGAAILPALFGLALAVPGSVLLFFRRGVTFNPQVRSLNRFWGIPGAALCCWDYSGGLDSFQSVECRKTNERVSVSRGDEARVTFAHFHEVSLKSADGNRRVVVYKDLIESKAGEVAERVAEFCGMKVTDGTE